MSFDRNFLSTMDHKHPDFDLNWNVLSCYCMFYSFFGGVW